jgi:hypothetical protein
MPKRPTLGRVRARIAESTGVFESGDRDSPKRVKHAVQKVDVQERRASSHDPPPANTGERRVPECSQSGEHRRTPASAASRSARSRANTDEHRRTPASAASGSARSRANTDEHRRTPASAASGSARSRANTGEHSSVHARPAAGEHRRNAHGSGKSAVSRKGAWLGAKAVSSDTVRRVRLEEEGTTVDDTVARRARGIGHTVESAKPVEAIPKTGEVPVITAPTATWRLGTFEVRAQARHPGRGRPFRRTKKWSSGRSLKPSEHRWPKRWPGLFRRRLQTRRLLRKGRRRVELLHRPATGGTVTIPGVRANGGFVDVVP